MSRCCREFITKNTHPLAAQIDTLFLPIPLSLSLSLCVGAVDPKDEVGSTGTVVGVVCDDVLVGPARPTPTGVARNLTFATVIDTLVDIHHQGRVAGG